MTPYSQDLRQRIVDTVQRGEGTVRQIAERFLVSVSFVTRLLQLHRSTGSVEPRPHGGGNPAVLTPEDLERLRELIRQQPDATLEECRTAPRRLVQPHDHLARPEQAGAAAQEEGPARRGAGPPGGPGADGGSSARNSPGSTRGGWSSWTSAGPTRR